MSEAGHTTSQYRERTGPRELSEPSERVQRLETRGVTFELKTHPSQEARKRAMHVGGLDDRLGSFGNPHLHVSKRHGRFTRWVELPPSPTVVPEHAIGEGPGYCLVFAAEQSRREKPQGTGVESMSRGVQFLPRPRRDSTGRGTIRRDHLPLHAPATAVPRASERMGKPSGRRRGSRLDQVSQTVVKHPEIELDEAARGIHDPGRGDRVSLDVAPMLLLGGVALQPARHQAAEPTVGGGRSVESEADGKPSGHDGISLPAGCRTCQAPPETGDSREPPTHASPRTTGPPYSQFPMNRGKAIPCKPDSPGGLAGLSHPPGLRWTAQDFNDAEVAMPEERWWCHILPRGDWVQPFDPEQAEAAIVAVLRDPDLVYEPPPRLNRIPGALRYEGCDTHHGCVMAVVVVPQIDGATPWVVTAAHDADNPRNDLRNVQRVVVDKRHDANRCTGDLFDRLRLQVSWWRKLELRKLTFVKFYRRCAEVALAEARKRTQTDEDAQRAVEGAAAQLISDDEAWKVWWEAASFEARLAFFVDLVRSAHG